MSQSKSPFQKPRLRIAAVASALMLALPGAATADSNAVTGACLEDEATVRACSSKELSNVVLQCSSESGSYFVKIDELDDGTYEGLISPNEGLFSCPEGEVLAVFIKSGANFYEGAEVAGLPPGSGAQWSPLSCDVEDAGCSSEGGEDGGGDGEGGTDEGVDPPE